MDVSAPRSTSSVPSTDDVLSDYDDDDWDEDASLTLSHARLGRFRALLRERNIVLQFYAGGWESFDLAEKMDLVLTSETVYQATNLSALVGLLRKASHPTTSSGEGRNTTTALIAAKVLYFGLEGGGVPAFEGAVRAETGGWTEEVWRSASGVKRWVGKVGWDA